MSVYLPEGMNTGAVHALASPDLVRRFLKEDALLELPCTMCDETGNLRVDLGMGPGLIPREQTALSESGARIAALAPRVGQFICCKLTGTDAQGRILLSRKAAQQAAFSQLLRRRPGEILPAVVTGLTSFGAFCDIGCGLPALIGLEAISVARIRHARDRFSLGQKILAVLTAVDPDTHRICLSHKELLGTWEENAALFSAGQTVTGTVRTVKDYGVFVELTPNLSGLADPSFPVEPGDPVAVSIKSIQPYRRKVKLRLLRKLDAASAPPRQALSYFQTEGRVDLWQYDPRDPGAPYTIF